MKMKTRRMIVYLILLSIFGVIAYNLYFQIFNKEKNTSLQQEEIVEQEEYGKEISIGIIGFDTFNPILTKNKDVINFSNLIYTRLFSFDKNMKLDKILVDEYNYNDSNLFIKLKKDVLWDNGNNLTSRDIKFTIESIKKYGGIYASCVSNIESVEIIDTYSLKLVLLDPSKMTEYDLIFPIVSNDYYENEDFEATNKNLIPLGAGVFRYSEKINDKQYLFKYNAFYNGEKTKIEKINVMCYETTGEGFANVKTRKVDVLNTSVLDYEKYIGTIGYNKVEYIENSFLCLAINKDNNYMGNKNIRKAMNLAIDKQGIFNNVYNEQGFVSQSLIYPHSYLYKNINESYDVDKAKQCMVDSNIKERISISFLISNSDTNNILIANLIKQQLEKINIFVTIDQFNNTEYLNKLNKHEYDVALINFTVSNSIDMNMLSTDNYYGIFNMKSDVINNYVSQINSQVDENKIKEVMYCLQDIIGDELPYIGIGFKENTLVLNNNLIGLSEARYNNIFLNMQEIYMKN